MQPYMSANELALFSSFVTKSDKYLEFGAGGSTFFASSHVKSWVMSIDSSQQWIDKVSRSCKEIISKPEMIFKDIGATGHWGYPLDESTKARWPDYHSDIWNLPKSLNADLYIIDGRFRVACFAQVVLHCRPDAIIGFHDFHSRECYHVVKRISREFASAEDLSFFQPLPAMREEAIRILHEYRFIAG